MLCSKIYEYKGGKRNPFVKAEKIYNEQLFNGFFYDDKLKFFYQFSFCNELFCLDC